METYLFFDIECANNFGHLSKICSFGYVLTDSQFNILEQQDLVINPEAKIQPHLLMEDSSCRLAYPKEYFAEQPTFPEFYQKIYGLLTAPDRMIFGFAVGNDINFVIDACIRYKLPFPVFDAYDTARLLQMQYHTVHSLSSWAQILSIDTSSLHAHKSSDDALMTMLVYRHLFLSSPPSDKAFNQAHFSSRQRIQAIHVDKWRRFVNLQIIPILDKLNPSPHDGLLCGEKFHLCIPGDFDISQIRDICFQIYDHGGIVTTRQDESINIVLIEFYNQKWLNKIKHAKIYSLKALYRRMNIESPVLLPQSTDIPDFDESQVDNIRSTSLAHMQQELNEQVSQLFYDEKIFEMQDEPCPEPKTNLLEGKKFRVLLSKATPIDEQYRVCSDIYQNGGILLSGKQDGCIFVKEDGKTPAPWMRDNPTYKFCTISGVYGMLSPKA